MSESSRIRNLFAGGVAGCGIFFLIILFMSIGLIFGCFIYIIVAGLSSM